MDFSGTNRGRLSAVYPGLFEALDRERPDPGLELQTAKNGGWALKRNGKFLHSSYDPAAEAIRSFSRQRGKFDLVIVAGLGAGHLLEAVLADPAVKAIRVLETDLGLLRLVFGRREVHQLLLDSRVRLIWRFDDRLLLTTPLDLITIRTVTVLGDPSYPGGPPSGVFGEAVFASMIDSRITELLTCGRLGMHWLDNFLANFSLRDRMVPATALGPLIRRKRDRILLVGAGPSLEALVPVLRRDAGRFLVVAIDTIAKYLEQNGIPPDIVISVDSQPVSRLHFQGYRPGKAVFLLDVLSPPSIVSRVFDRAYFCRSANSLSGLFSAEIPAGAEGLSAANTAVELLHRLGAAVIYLAGVDFSFPKDRVYTGGNYFSLFWSGRVHRTATLDGYFLGLALERKRETCVTLSGAAADTVPVMRRYAEALDGFLSRNRDLTVYSLSDRMIATRQIKVAPIPAAGGTDSGPAPSREPAKAPAVFREIRGEFLWPAFYALVYRRFRRNGRTSESDGEWARRVLDLKIAGMRA